jgi:hypothetical protein
VAPDTQGKTLQEIESERYGEGIDDPVQDLVSRR